MSDDESKLNEGQTLELKFVVNNQSSNKDKIDEEDWDNKYDVVLEILRNEYQNCIESFRNVDAKVEKYILAITLVFASVFSILASSLPNKLVFSFENMKLIHILSMIFCGLLLTGFYWAWQSVTELLKGLEITQVYRINHVNNMMNRKGNFVKFKGGVINDYITVIDKMYVEVIPKKQKYLIGISMKIKKSIIFLFFAFCVLFFIQYI